MAKEHAIGGQAVLEGVMLKSDKNLVVCVRNSKGKIVSMKKRLKKKKKWQRLFFIRGIVNLVDMLKIGLDSLFWSGNIADDGEGEVKGWEWFLIILLSMVFVVGFFIVLPFYITRFVASDRGLMFNLIDGVLRIILFGVYIAAIGMTKDIKRVFQYHGAEHKAVNCYEHVKDAKKVTLSRCRKFSPIHPRCGSSFIMIVLVISIIMFSLIITDSVLVRLCARVVIIPIIMGISYELLKFSSKHMDNPLMKALLRPGLSLQKLTTDEPDSKQLEVGIAALKLLAKLDKR